MKQAAFKQTAAGKYKELKKNRLTQSTQSNPSPPKRKPASYSNDASSQEQDVTLLHKLKQEWENKDLSTQSIKKLEGILQVLNSEEGKAASKKMVQGVCTTLRKIPIKGVMNAMGKDKFQELFKNLGSNENTADLLKTMMEDPDMKQTAMDMMKDMMSDEKKLAEMTDLMSKMLKDD